MKIKNLLFILFLYNILITNVYAQEISFQAIEMDIKEDGNLIIAFNSETDIPSENLKIYSDKVQYNKKTDIIIFTKNVVINDLENDVKINSNRVIYEKKKNLIFSKGRTKFNIEDIYKINSENVYYDRSLEKIYSESKTDIKDIDNNYYELNKRFSLDVKKEVLKSKKSIIIDNKKNKYIFDDLILNLKTNEIVGKEVKVEFNKSHFGNENNDPILRGRGSFSNDDKLEIYKAVFSTCNIENKKCRGWELSSDEFKHNKIKKIYEYKDSWLKIFDFRVFYLPYFNHPDPSVKRKSGFLTPSYSSSGSLGTAINFPYFKVLGTDRDVTFSPRYYIDKSFLLQNEYRQALENSNVLSDFSFLVGDEGTKGHFFYNQVGSFNQNTNYEINLQDVKGDNYLKKHKLVGTSKLITSGDLLKSNFNVNWNFEESILKTSVRMYKDLSRDYNDRYQYIFPSFNFVKNLSIPEEYNGNFSFYSSGHHKNYNTNVTEAVITNDFLFESNNYVSSFGLITNYNLLLKNSNNYLENPSANKEDTNYDVFGTIKIDTSYPLQKNMDNYTHFLKPIASFRYSPNGNSDLSSDNILLNYNSVFSLNRIGSSSEVEGGESLSLGLEFERNNNITGRELDFKVANVLKPKKRHKLPSKSKLDETRSDIFGILNYYPNDYVQIGYNFSYDRDLKHSNLEGVNFGFNMNNFLTNFYYYTEDNDIGNNEILSNNTTFKINDENKFKFNTRKDLKDDFTQYYNLMYEYLTDCLSINLNYNKSFYRDGNLEPTKNLSFLIKIIPFTELGVPNVKSMINR